MDNHPDCVSTYTPLQNQLCYATWVTYTWVALLLRRPFLAIELCFVHLWRNQVGDHFKLKSRDGVFWMEVYQRLSEFTYTQMEKVWSRITLVHNNFFLKLFDVCLCNVLVLCYYFFFFNFHIIILVDRTCWLSGHNHLYNTQGHIIILFFIGTNSMFACFQMYVESTFFLFCFFFQLSYDFFWCTDMFWLSRRNHLYIPRSHPTECVYCSAQSFCFLEKQTFLFTSSTWRRQCGYLPHTSWKCPENKTNRVRRQLGDKMFSTVAKSVSGSQCLCSTKFVFLSQEHTGIHYTHKHDFLHKK